MKCNVFLLAATADCLDDAGGNNRPCSPLVGLFPFVPEIDRPVDLRFRSRYKIISCHVTLKQYSVPKKGSLVARSLPFNDVSVRFPLRPLECSLQL